MGGGRFTEVVAHGGSTVYGYDVISAQTEKIYSCLLTPNCTRKMIKLLIYF